MADCTLRQTSVVGTVNSLGLSVFFSNYLPEYKQGVFKCQLKPLLKLDRCKSHTHLRVRLTVPVEP